MKIGNQTVDRNPYLLIGRVLDLAYRTPGKERIAVTVTDDESTSDAILRVGQHLMQTLGYDGFSYRDIADQVGIRSATIHYHFPTKADLAASVAARYRVAFAETVSQIDDQLEPIQRLRAYAGLFQSTLEDANRVCLCGMLASESASIPAEVLQETDQFFAEQEQWVAEVIASLGTNSDVAATAKLFIAALEGGMIVARSVGDSDYLTQIVERLLELIRNGTA